MPTAFFLQPVVGLNMRLGLAALLQPLWETGIMNDAIDRIREHIKVLNHSSERMANSMDALDNDMSKLAERVSAIETNIQWLMRLVMAVLGSVLALVFKVFAN